MDAKMGQIEEAQDLHDLYTAAEELFRRRMVEEAADDNSGLQGHHKSIWMESQIL
ncbi:hypothetical protein HanRHA438_Chr04g0192461 [Helianthus annuus]|nr:hypothetical protein HanIR_Chr04g0196641 [Helianthus annuus]KAJ0928292.1 hypothetical protein HanRHA438_Chr04g0192461 [Helianthus annuus]